MAKDTDVTVSRLPSISMKTAGYSAKELRKLVEGNAEVQFLARIGGVVVEAFTGESKNGEWTGLKGMFTLINRDNKAFSSTVAFLPSNITNRIADQLNQGVIEVQFLVDINITETEKNAAGYAFMAESVLSDDAAKKMETITSRVLTSKLPSQLKIAGKKSA